MSFEEMVNQARDLSANREQTARSRVSANRAIVEAELARIATSAVAYARKVNLPTTPVGTVHKALLGQKFVESAQVWVVDYSSGLSLAEDVSWTVCKHTPLYTETLGQKLRHDMGKDRNYGGGGSNSYVLNPGRPLTAQDFNSNWDGTKFSTSLRKINDYDEGSLSLTLEEGVGLVVEFSGVTFEQWVARTLAVLAASV